MTELLPHIYAIEVPMDAKDMTIGERPENPIVLYTLPKSFFPNEVDFVDLPKGKFFILGTVKYGKIDFDVSGLVEKRSVFSKWNVYRINEYVDYIGGGVMYHANDSFRSLLSSKQLDPNKQYVIIKKK